MAKRQFDPDLQAQLEARKAHEEIERAVMSTNNDFFAEQDIERTQLERDCSKSARSIRMMYDSYMNEGFTEEQAWELIKLQVAGASQPRRLF